MSDFGQSSAIEQTNNLISEGMENARNTREHNRSVLNTYNTTITNINNKKDAVGVSDKTADTGEESVSGIQTAVAFGQEINKARKMGAVGYLKNIPQEAMSNIQGALKAGKDAMGVGQSSARDALTAGRSSVVLSNPGSLEQSGEELGFTSGVFKKGLQAITDLPDKQIAGIAKGLGAFTGVASGALTGIEDLASGSFGTDEKGKPARGVDKAENIGSLVAGGLDAMALAVPVLAPVAGVADVVESGLSLAKDKADKAEDIDTATKTKQQDMETGTGAIASAGSQGQIAGTSTAQRTY